MKELLCIFKPHNWIYLGKGLYQCTRCKQISWGYLHEEQIK